MNIESFENEIVQLENQLRDAITAQRALQEIQATFQDMQPRYERLKQLIDVAGQLPQHYSQKFATVIQDAEVRLAGLETPIRQQQDHLVARLDQYQQQMDTRLAAFDAIIQQQQAGLDTMVAQYQQVQQDIHHSQARLEHAVALSVTKWQQALDALDQRMSTAHTQLQASVDVTLQDHAMQQGRKSEAQFNKALVIGLLACAIAMGAWIFILAR